MRLAALVVTLIFLGVALVPSPASAAAGAPGGIPWGMDVTTTNVTYGQNISVILYGPANGTVVVSVYVQPFKSTPPAEQYQFTLNATRASNHTANRTLSVITTNTTNQTSQVYRNVSVPTTLLGVETVDLCAVDDLGTSLGCSYVYLLGGDIQNIQREINNLTQEQNIQAYRQQHEANTTNNIQNAMDLVYWVFLGLSSFLLFVVAFTQTSLANVRLGRRLREWAHALFFGENNVEFDDGMRKPAGGPPPSDPERRFRGLAFKNCLACTIDQTEEEIRAHYRSAHGVPRPIKNLDYGEKRSSTRRAVTTRADADVNIANLREWVDLQSKKGAVNFSDLGGAK